MTNAMTRVMVKTAVAVAPAGRTVESPRRALSPRQKLSAMRDRLVLVRRQPLCGKSMKKVDIIALADEEEELTDATAPCDDRPIVAHGTTMLLSATVVEFHDRYDYCENNSYKTPKDKVDNRRDDDDDGGGGDEPGSWDTFMAKLLRRIACCSPRDGSSVNEMIHEDGVTTDNENIDDRISTIELILRQSLCEGMDGFADPEPTSSTVDTQQQSSRNDNDFMMPSSDDWVHDPLLFIATSGTGMKVLRIRRVSEPSYHNSQDIHDITNFDKDRPVQLPINNGKELPSDTRVIDFETNTFAGTALLRIRGSTGCNGPESNNKYNTTKHDYFAKQNRKFQMVISGRFKSNVIMANCMSGILLDHHLTTASAPGSVDDVLDNMSNCAEGLPFLDESDGISKSSLQVTNHETNDKRKRVVVRTLKKGKSTSSSNDNLPSKWALRAAVKVAGVFSPRMDADLECEHPRILSPLCSSAQTIIVSRNYNSGGGNSTRIEELLKEPPISSDASLVKDICKSLTTNHNKHASTINPTQQRKCLFDDVYDVHTDSSSQAGNSSTVCFDPNAEYTFEFLQHLIDYNDLSLDLGKIIGKVKLSGGLRGQPARFVSVVKKRRHVKPTPDNLDFLWSFDIWHKSCT